MPGVDAVEPKKLAAHSIHSATARREREEMGAASSPSSINITIQKFQDKIEIHSATVKEGAQQIGDLLTQAMVKAVNDFQKVAGV